MRARWLGWAGLQLAGGGSSVVIDPLQDAGAVWAAAGELARDVPLPAVVAAEPPASAGVGLLTHLHRDHADAAALASALAPGAPVLVPPDWGGSGREQAALAEAGRELAEAGLELRRVDAWERVSVDGWVITALPAADGTGDPQLSWLVERDGVAVVHAGDTLFHGWWWRIAQRAQAPIAAAYLPVNAPRVSFPHRQPPSTLPIAMDGEQAVVASRLLGARVLVPVHVGAYEFPPVYVPDPGALAAVQRAAAEHGVDVREPQLGAWMELPIKPR